VACPYGLHVSICSRFAAQTGTKKKPVVKKAAITREGIRFTGIRDLKIA